MITSVRVSTQSMSHTAWRVVIVPHDEDTTAGDILRRARVTASIVHRLETPRITDTPSEGAPYGC